MKHSLTYFTAIIIVFSSLLYSCGGKEEKTEQKPKKIPLVKVQEVSLTKLVSSIDITGTVQANTETEVKSPADGIIETLLARENQYVEKDKLIAVINPTDRVSLISSNIEKIENLEFKLKTTDKNSEVYQNLLSDIEKSKSDLEYAKNMYKTIPVVCPMNGLVTQRWLDKGSQVSTKENIITITDMSSLVIKAEVNERYFEAIKQGKRLPVILNAYPND
ncbi:MAG: efflux RND transporter periplasmic adaptor subunit, partial [Candidatus Kapaibacterium sp.]